MKSKTIIYPINCKGSSIDTKFFDQEKSIFKFIVWLKISN